MALQEGMRMLDGLKSKLGFGAKGSQGYDDGYYDDYDDSYGDYDEFSEYADDYADDYDDGYGYDGGYSSRSGRDRYQVTSRAGGYGSRGGSSSLPRLLSIDDVRAGTRATSRTMRETRTYGSVGGRDLLDSSLPYSMTPEGSAAVSAAAGIGSRQATTSRRGGAGAYSTSSSFGGGAARDFSDYEGSPFAKHDSSALASRPLSGELSQGAGEGRLSESLRGEARSSSFASAGASGSSSAGSAGASSGRRRAASTSLSDDRDSDDRVSVRTIRALTVLKPTRYGEAERVTQALKKGDAVALDLRGATGGLDKRILDFSFGAANALNAEVECIADKVFVIAIGKGLSDEERNELRAKGVM